MEPEQLEIEEYIIEGDDYIARMELPTEPTPNELIQIIDYLDNHADSYVDLYNKGPFVVAAGISFVVDDTGTKVVGKPYELPAPLLLVTEENGQAVIDLVDELYSAEDYVEQFAQRVLN